MTTRPAAAALVVLAALVASVLGGCKEDPSGRPARDAATGTSDAPSHHALPDGSRTDGARADGPSADAPGQASHDCNSPHPAWLLCDDFEKMADGVDAWFSASGWTEALGLGNAGRLTSSTDAHGGSYALHMPAAASAGYRGADLLWRACAAKNEAGCEPLLGYPQLYFRAYIRLANDHRYVHHFLNISGGPLDDYYGPYGNAGCRPNGKRGMGTTVDFKKDTHETFFYTYYPSMNCDSGSSCANYADPQAICDGCAKKDMPCTNGLECCWGNHFAPDTPVALPVGKWFCLEMMMRPNDVGQSNGEMAYWIDGTLGHRTNGMRWREVDTLQLNMVRLQHYITTEDAKGFSNKIWFDDVVVSTERIGCIEQP